MRRWTKSDSSQSLSILDNKGAILKSKEQRSIDYTADALNDKNVSQETQLSVAGDDPNINEGDFRATITEILSFDPFIGESESNSASEGVVIKTPNSKYMLFVTSDSVPKASRTAMQKDAYRTSKAAIIEALAEPLLEPNYKADLDELDDLKESLKILTNTTSQYYGAAVKYSFLLKSCSRAAPAINIENLLAKMLVKVVENYKRVKATIATLSELQQDLLDMELDEFDEEAELPESLEEIIRSKRIEKSRNLMRHSSNVQSFGTEASPIVPKQPMESNHNPMQLPQGRNANVSRHTQERSRHAGGAINNDEERRFQQLEHTVSNICATQNDRINAQRPNSGGFYDRNRSERLLENQNDRILPPFIPERPENHGYQNDPYRLQGRRMHDNMADQFTYNGRNNAVGDLNAAFRNL